MQEINYQNESEKIIEWIGKVFSKSEMKYIIIGMSGGIDSSVSCALAAKAVGKEKIMPVLLPYGFLSSEGLEDAQSVINYLEIKKEQVKVIDIQNSVNTVLESLSQDSGKAETTFRKGNIMARIRMICLFDIAKQYQGLVCGTENKAEHYLGYFTRFGDEASDIEPIRHLYKTHVWGMGKYLGLPEKIITKPPTAGLWDGQTDEKELGFSYKEADQVLYYLIDKKLSEKEIKEKGINVKIIQKVWQRVRENEFKHHLPFVYAV